MVPKGDQGEVLFMGLFLRNRMKFHRAPVTPFEMTPEIMGMKGKYERPGPGWELWGPELGSPGTRQWLRAHFDYKW